MSLFNIKKKKLCTPGERDMRANVPDRRCSFALQLLLQRWVGSGRARLAEGFGCSSSEHM